MNSFQNEDAEIVFASLSAELKRFRLASVGREEVPARRSPKVASAALQFKLRRATTKVLYAQKMARESKTCVILYNH